MPDRIAPASESQSAGAVLMVRPAQFGFNPETAASNAFQHASAAIPVADVKLHAQVEFDALAAALERAGVRVCVADDMPAPPKPDAVFPNNWVSFHQDGSVVLYPMMAPNRRLERRLDIVDQVARETGFHVRRTLDLTHHEAAGRFLEGTGSLVLDRHRRVAYAGVSPRTERGVLAEFAATLGYDSVLFEAVDGAGNRVYHTNVVMAIGSEFAVLCSDALTDPQERTTVCERLEADGHEIIDISAAQMLEFAGNVLELTPRGGRLLALSTTAWRALDSSQRRALEKYASMLPVDIPMIERFGGGGVRCMLAEVPVVARAAAPAAMR